MIAFAADEDFNNLIVRGLRRRRPEADVVRAQDAGLVAASDELILEWAAREHRVLLTHDVQTMLLHAYQRVSSGAGMTGVLVVPQWLSIGDAIEDLVLVVACSEIGDWRDRVVHFPLR
jgi:Domain of unknown function (DUF5615)